MQDVAVELFQLLVQAGAVPGDDFSCDGANRVYRLNERCLHLLQHAYPEVDWFDLVDIQQQSSDAMISALHERLGVPFVDNLIARMEQRLQRLPEAQAAWYVRHILSGVEYCTGLALFPVLSERLPLMAKAKLEWLLRQDDGQPGDEWIADLVLAAGGCPRDLRHTGHGLGLTEQGLQRLQLVWAGDCEVTLLPPKQP
ncbi:hypothetical protein XM38_049150 [Halomicronema hongdechloris C2206]|uniref:Uncharacterized protein n=1 Tax=Halomicronema hongdechloris C2206 TaxID=1641165 RepID=A0A1Z3HUE8_9CYAN|nr:hypothetical protein [Halomicronema hongdechloris]ASC73941.1 hypothetical protein XM38_049150 [Halomicronema hongdechloris C2206]